MGEPGTEDGALPNGELPEPSTAPSIDSNGAESSTANDLVSPDEPSNSSTPVNVPTNPEDLARLKRR